MNALVSKFAEPFTPRGVAAFARVKSGWLFLAQAVIALIAATSLTCFLDANCYSVIHTAIQNLPDTGKISFGRLHWDGDSSKMLAEGQLLAIDVDVDHSGTVHSTADIQVEFGHDSIRVYSILPGYSEIYYPEWPAPFNRTDLQPKWDAWEVDILFITAAAAFITLLISWLILATIYFLPVWIAGFLANRELNLWASWKLSAAAVLPGALLMIAGIWLYDFGQVHLVSFSFIFAAHFVLGWIYLAASFFFLPRVSTATPKGNPFETRK
ncbi:MAG TPA: hypothetical protein VGI03_02850 [Verrucomicrobiae bacterium]|jgi:hypothetical protein